MTEHIKCMGCNSKIKLTDAKCLSCDTEVELSIKSFAEAEKAEIEKAELTKLRAEREENDKVIAMLRERMIEVEGEETRKIDEVQALNSSKNAQSKPATVEIEKLPLHERLLYLTAFAVMVVGMTASLSLPLTGIILAVGALLITPKVKSIVLARHKWLKPSNLFLISHTLIIAGFISVSGFVTELEEESKLQKLKSATQDGQQITATK